jgi:hypothetical protein
MLPDDTPRKGGAMALSFEQEIDFFLQHRFEQLPAAQWRTTPSSGSLIEGIETLTAIVFTLRDAIMIMAREIDELRADISP